MKKFPTWLVPPLLLAAIGCGSTTLPTSLTPPAKGDIVLYTMEFDSDTSYTPNVGPALVTKIHPTEIVQGMPKLDLAVFAINGVFFIDQVGYDPSARRTWHLKP